MTIKTLNVHFSFKLESDEFGLHNVPALVKEWIAAQRKEWPDDITVDPVTDAPGLRQIRKRGPNKKRAAALQEAAE